MPDSTEIWLKSIESSVRDSLDRMAMLDLTIDPSTSVARDSEKALQIVMELRGDAATRVELHLSKELATIWSAALTGVEEDELESEDVEDGACELLNMVAGATKTRLGDIGIQFELGIPEVVPMNAASDGKNGKHDPVVFRAQVGGNPLEIAVSFD